MKSEKNTSDFLLKLFGWVAKTGYGSDRCLKHNFLPVRFGSDSMIPDPRDLSRRKVWDKKSSLSGIDFNQEKQLALLDDLGKKFGCECRWPAKPTAKRSEFFVTNNSFLYGCAASTHSIIRKYKPKRVIEIGSGYSSVIIANALRLNQKQNGTKPEYVVVDPYPLDFILKKEIQFDELIKERVELLKPDFFKRLKPGDLLFIDSGHVTRIGSDVNFLYLEVLPRLGKNIIIHSHDIFLPYNYPRFFAESETFRQFWTESYLLQAFLAFNDDFEVLLAMYYLMRNYQKRFKSLYPSYNPKMPGGRLAFSPSLWMRKK